MSGPLSHIRVLDMSRILAGPWSGQNLADLGAEVIKIERPGTGDDTRGWGPPFVKDVDGNDTADAAYFLCANRGKKSVAIDISKPAGQEVVRALAAVSDVLIENYKVGGLAGYGLGYDDLKAVNPGLVYCSITGFGQSGPYRGRAGYDFIIQGMGGLMSVTGEADSRPGGGPQKVGVALADVITGMYATVSILAALSHRDHGGAGQRIDLALFDVQVAALANQATNYLIAGEAPVRLGNAHPNIVPYQAFKTADHHLILAIGNDAQFGRFCQVASRPELAADSRFATNVGRVGHRDELIAIIESLLSQRSRDDWLEALEGAGIPSGPINTVDQVFADPQTQFRGTRIDLPHALAGTVPSVKSPMNFSESEIDYGIGPPVLGEHTEAVLKEILGMDEEAIAGLRDQGVI